MNKEILPPNPARNDEDSTKIWFRPSYCGDKGVCLLKSCIKKLKRNMKRENNVYFKIIYDTVKISYFTNSKDKVPPLSQSFVVYEYNCPGCNSSYIGQTERTMYERSYEHAWKDKNSAINKHINCCSGFKHLIDLRNLDNELFSNAESSMIKEHHIYSDLVRNNTKVIDKTNNWNILLFKDSLHIKNENQP